LALVDSVCAWDVAGLLLLSRWGKKTHHSASAPAAPVSFVEKNGAAAVVLGAACVSGSVARCAPGSTSAVDRVINAWNK
jgi:hypothetical protein